MILMSAGDWSLIEVSINSICTCDRLSSRYIYYFNASSITATANQKYGLPQYRGDIRTLPNS
ncbi:hypothetical protein H6G58_12155 [Arthrospira platensis FACHB-971]|uniref:hypothetical protein n=2 Tax=Oscillatoriophycideae TaxID=1301283 RepID=UPI000319E843|nr:hypothetical protein [Arthrospira sp. PLM2.Bin9]AMW29406.1 hypothetical protein AP285_17105 [Arthrospira platensis YZ]MBD2573767.1 hypothetical protein [Arthrospira platensis FACHB-971]MBD2670021.1 hypothetical protein [Arthrospira platensis FACHB-439]MBD2710759.1 hypothetical protein [Arthrospira platensis FACHB-835]MDT9183351.1 hypothetical protein [Limnospira sp. PMC 289.06]MDT9311150.1 hypothetical protein [Limnospira sp. Paracas R14]